MKNEHVLLFGGSFDPIHIGHTQVAECVTQQLDCNRVIFIPAHRSPHKEDGPVASGRQRMEMVDLAIRGHEGFEVSDCELHRPAPSYTLDTVRWFRRKYGEECELSWIVGADAVESLGGWYHIGELVEECHLRVMYRAGFARPSFAHLRDVLGESHVAKLESDVVSTPLIDVSSREIRYHLGRGEDVSGMVHPRVLGYIRRNHLYV